MELWIRAWERQEESGLSSFSTSLIQSLVKSPWTLSLENTATGYQPPVGAVDQRPLIRSLVKLKFAGYLKG